MSFQERFEVLGQISGPSFLKVRSRRNNKQMAAKLYSFASKDDRQKKKIIEEVNTLMSIKSPNIVKYEDYILDKPNACLYVIMEYCEGGSLQDFIDLNRQSSQLIEEKAIWKIFSGVVTAVSAIHQDKKGVIVHREIQPMSVFLDQNNSVKLGNFSLIKRLNSSEQFELSCLPASYYRCPEQITQGIFTSKSDIWALGCLLYEMATLKVPFRVKSQFETCRRIKENDYGQIPSSYSKQLNRVIRWCLQKQPEMRPSVTKLLSLPEIGFRIKSRRNKENLRILIDREQALRQRQSRIAEKQKQLQDLTQRMQAMAENKQNEQALVNVLSSAF